MRRLREPNRVQAWIAVERERAMDASVEFDVLVTAAYCPGQQEWFDYRKGVGGPRIEPELELQSAVDASGAEVELTKDEEKRAIEALWDALREE